MTSPLDTNSGPGPIQRIDVSSLSEEESVDFPQLDKPPEELTFAESALKSFKSVSKVVGYVVTSSIVIPVAIAVLAVAAPFAGLYFAISSIADALKEKATEEGHSTRTNYCKSQASKVGGEIANVFTQRLPEHLFSPKEINTEIWKDIDVLLSNLRGSKSIDSNAEKILSKEDNVFLEKIADNNFKEGKLTLSSPQYNRLSSIKEKLELRTEFYKLSELVSLDKDFVPSKVSEKLQQYLDKKTPLSDSEVKDGIALYQQAHQNKEAVDQLFKAAQHFKSPILDKKVQEKLNQIDERFLTEDEIKNIQDLNNYKEALVAYKHGAEAEASNPYNFNLLDLPFNTKAQNMPQEKLDLINLFLKGEYLHSEQRVELLAIYEELHS